MSKAKIMPQSLRVRLAIELFVSARRITYHGNSVGARTDWASLSPKLRQDWLDEADRFYSSLLRNSMVVTPTAERVYSSFEPTPQEEERVNAVTERDPVRDYVRWVVALDEPMNEQRRTITLTRIIDYAREALGVGVDPEG